MSLVAVIFGASALFYHLRHALNLQWGLDMNRNVRGAVVSRLAAFSMVLVVGLFMVVFFGVHAALAALWRLWGPYVPLPGRVWTWKLANTGASLVFLSVLFAVVYRVLPAVRLRWKEALVGGSVTSALVTVANQVIGLYFRFAHFKSLYGAGAAVLVVLLWVYLSAQVFLFGAEFTWALARRQEESDA
jgi:membrane protein